MGTKDLLPFLKALDKVVDVENDAEIVELDSGTVDSETPAEATWWDSGASTHSSKYYKFTKKS